MAVASASLRTSMLSMSLGLMLLSGLLAVRELFWARLSEMKGTPLTRYSGEVPDWMEPLPLICTLNSEPGRPFRWVMTRPATLPCKAASGLLTGWRERVAALTLAMLPVLTLSLTL